MDNNRFHVLIEAYIAGHLDKEGAAELLALLAEAPAMNELEALVDHQLENHIYDRNTPPPLTRQRIMNGLKKAITGKAKTAPIPRKSVLRPFYIAAAAVFLLLAAGTGWLLLHNRHQASSPGRAAAAAPDISPGRSGALLKLSNHQTIRVDTAKEGLIAMDGNVAIYKENGSIIYKGVHNEVVYNEMVTDRGRQYAATLPDGSMVWLNAMSSLRYPLHFTGKERAVTLTGEARFKVVHNDRMPFRVYIRKNNMDAGVVDDLGTEFNIKAYSDEAVIKTSVAEGSVALRTSADAVIKATPGVHLKAGQQAQMNENDIRIFNDASIDQAMAWSQGVFSFNGEPIEDVMRQLTRWYDIEVVYEGKPANIQFGGEIAMNQSLSQVLKGLASMNINYRIENKRIVVMP